jgi:hypothetical protein
MATDQKRDVAEQTGFHIIHSEKPKPQALTCFSSAEQKLPGIWDSTGFVYREQLPESLHDQDLLISLQSSVMSLSCGSCQ